MKINNIWMRLIIFAATNNLMISFASSEEIALGSVQAPITLIEYGSLTCSNCIKFHEYVLPRVKKNYIDTGTVRFIYRHFPTSEAAIQGAVAAQCAGEKYYEMLDELYSSVVGWYKAENMDSIFVRKATSLGLNSEVFRSCISDGESLDDVVSQQQSARKDFNVTVTPTFVINGKIVHGKKSFSEMKNLINEAHSKNITND